MAQVVKHLPKPGPETQREALDGVTRAHPPAFPSRRPGVGPARGGGGGHGFLGRQRPRPGAFAVGHTGTSFG